MRTPDRKSLRPLLRGLGSAGRRARDLFPLTSSGLAVATLAAAALWFFGVRMLDLILLTASTLVILLTLILAVVTPLSALLVHRRLRSSEQRQAQFECGVWSATGLSARPPRWLPFLVLSVSWTSPERVEAELRGSAGLERVCPSRRGRFSGVTRRFRLEDQLGLTAVSWTERAPGQTTILPARAPVNSPSAVVGMVGGEDLSDPFGRPAGDRVDMRKYGHGDSPRMILWKTYARTRKLFVRIPERAVETAPRICAYLVASDDDEPAATLARTVLEKGMLGPAWRFGADGAEPAEDLPGALEALAVSGSTPEGTPSGLGAFLDGAAADGFGACLLFLPYREGSWTAGVRDALGTSPMRIRAVAAVPGWREAMPPGLWRRLLSRRAEQTAASPGEVWTLIRGLAFPGTQFALADVDSGDVMVDPEAYLARLATATEAA